MGGWIGRVNRRLMSRDEEAQAARYAHAAYQDDALGAYRAMLSKIGMPLAGKAVLDVGCGPGHWLAACASFHPALLIGGDSSDAMLRSASAAGAQQRGIRFFRGDAMAIPAQSSRFDLVICSLVLPYVPSDQRTIAELARVCKPQARLLIGLHGLGFYLSHVFAHGDMKYLIVPPLSWLSFVMGKKLLWNTYQTVPRLTRQLATAGCRVETIQPDGTFWGAPYITYVVAQKR